MEEEGQEREKKKEKVIDALPRVFILFLVFSLGDAAIDHHSSGGNKSKRKK